jgi:ring-1,2-phenylacetyl-CoA epoxidase subunit PaaD
MSNLLNPQSKIENRKSDTLPIWEALKEVKDPEIPTISLVDLGVITDVWISDDNVAHVSMTPTFVGCPAIDYMREDVLRRLRQLPFADVDVQVNFDVQWSTNRLTEEGKKRLLEHGLAPPEPYEGVLELEVLNNTPCPFCGSRSTTLQSPFGPTLCRSIHYCNSCHQAFEGFKPI